MMAPQSCPQSINMQKHTVNHLWPTHHPLREDQLSFHWHHPFTLVTPPKSSPRPPSEIFSADSGVFLRKTCWHFGGFCRGCWERRSCHANNDKWRGEGLFRLLFLRRRRLPPLSGAAVMSLMAQSASHFEGRGTCNGMMLLLLLVILLLTRPPSFLYPAHIFLYVYIS